VSPRRGVLDAIDSLLGTTSSRHDGVVRVRGSGVYANEDDSLRSADVTDGLQPSGIGANLCTRRRHSKLRGDARCRGCGRTKNEIEIEDG